MNFSLSDKRVLVLFSIIAVLLAANLFLMMQPKQQSQLSLYKAFAEQTHSSMGQLKAESASALSSLVETPDMNAEQRAQLALQKDFYFSMNSDVGWISDKENAVYWQLASTQNPLQANELMRKEMAILVIANYIFGLNSDAINDGLSGLIDENETVEEATAALSWVEVKDLLNDDTAQQMIAETLVQKQDIINESKALMQEYLDLRKNAFTQAKKGSNAEYVEAVKLLELAYLLELNVTDTNSQ